MIFRQLFHQETGTYTYLLAGRSGGEAMLIDPVLDRADRYMQLLEELDLKLVKVVDTHVHADHITAMGELRDRTKCVTVMGEEAPVDVVSMRVKDGDMVTIEGVQLETLYTPGHTIDSYCFKMTDRVFTGDTLLIRGSGRTDFQSGSSRAAYDSIFSKLLTLPDNMLVYPGHDYKGDTVSTIGEEKAHNPRLQVSNADEYVAIMDNLNLANPSQMDVAVPANIAMGLGQSDAAHPDWALTVGQLMALQETSDLALVDLREDSERANYGQIPGSIHAPYGSLDTLIGPGGLLREMAAAADKPLIYYCAYGERSAMAVQASKDSGLENIRHLIGGIAAWVEAGGPIQKD
ncbi:MAG: MBL fold metallo-hydrolase [Rhodospirillaceae bacterium]|nr:MBL fold metallo-hydrolase [Rhodospirillaceae bacterium]MBT5677053.1 MBL fold metallo-hydrolase [Rhodospirillaceae bacterium]